MGLKTDYEVLDTILLSSNWAKLTTSRLRVTFSDGSVEEQWREMYDRGDGAVILPFDPVRNHVLLVRQFRWPAAYNHEEDVHLIEAAAGLLENASPEEGIAKEAAEELGLELRDPCFLFQLYSSPGSISERLHYFLATYSAADVNTRGGLRSEGEETEILDLPLEEALGMLEDGRIRDAKTAVLLYHVAQNLMPGDAT